MRRTCGNRTGIARATEDPRGRRTHARLRVLLLPLCIAVTLGACATQQPLRGRVAVSSMGPQPLTTLVTDSTGPVVLEGELEPELRRLNGAQVEVEGPRTDTPPNGGIDVHRYVILEIDGEAPFVGMLDASGTRLTIEDGSVLRLDGLPDPIRANGTARIWVIGDRREDVVAVRSAGVIRDDQRGR